MKISKFTLTIFILICIANISCSQPKINQNKNLPYKITISGTEGLKFDGYYSTREKGNAKSEDSIHIKGVIPAEYYVNDSYEIICHVGKQAKGLIRITISGKENGDVAADSSNDEYTTLYVKTLKREGNRFSGPGIKNSPPAFFLNVTSKDNIPHSLVLFKEWDAGLYLSSTLTQKCPFTVSLPQCDVIAASFFVTTDMSEFYVTLTDDNNNILKKDSSDGKSSFDFEFRTKPKDNK